MEELRAKSSAAEALIEELMEENEELKKEMRQMVDEMEELQEISGLFCPVSQIIVIIQPMIEFMRANRLARIKWTNIVI